MIPEIFTYSYRHAVITIRNMGNLALSDLYPEACELMSTTLRHNEHARDIFELIQNEIAARKEGSR